MRFTKLFAAAAAILLPAGILIAADMEFSVGPQFVPGSPQFYDLNVMVDRVNGLSDGSYAVDSLDVTGNAAIGGNAAITGTLGVTGAATLSSTLAVTGAVTPTGGVAAAGGFSLNPSVISTGNQPPDTSSAGTDATPVATEVYIAQINIPYNVTVTGLACFNGSVASGNYKVGLANSAGAVVATSASTAMSGTDAYQRVAFTSTYAAKGPATYYALQFVDNNTARINTHTVGNFGASKQTGQTYATGFTTITPPTTFTTALGPMCGLY